MSDNLCGPFLLKTLRFTDEFEEAHPEALVDISRTLLRLGKESDPSLMTEIQKGLIQILEDMAKEDCRFTHIQIFAGRHGENPFDKIAIQAMMDNQLNVVVAALTVRPHESKGYLFFSGRNDAVDCEAMAMYDLHGDYIDGQSIAGFKKSISNTSMLMDFVGISLALKGELFRPSEFGLFLSLPSPGKPRFVGPEADGVTCHK